MIKSKCKFVKEIPSKAIDFWIRDIEPVGTPIPEKICIKRAISFTKLNEQGLCPANYKKCGSFGCVLKDTDCPLNTLKTLEVANEADANVVVI